MLTTVRLQVLDPTDVYRLHTKRTVRWRIGGEPNPNRLCTARPNGFGFHNADWVIEDRTTEREMAFGPPDRNDPRWPRTCKCGYAFQEEDDWLYFGERLWQLEDGQCFELNDAPAGSVWDAYWMPRTGEHAWTGPDGLCLVVRTPHGDWWVDGPDVAHNRVWTRHGTLPRITVTPGARLGNHLWTITDGELHLQ